MKKSDKLFSQLQVLESQMQNAKDDRDIGTIKELSPIIKSLKIEVQKASDLEFFEENGMTRNESRKIANDRVFNQVLGLVSGILNKPNPYDSSLVDSVEREGEKKANW